MNKKRIQIFITIACSIIFQSFIYFITKLTPFEYHSLSSNFDNKIPFVNIFVYFYIIWYILIFILPYKIYKHDKDKFKKYLLGTFISSIISGIIYFIYPTIINRPNISIDGLNNFLISVIYFFDTPAVNCLPSMHCLLSFLLIFYIISIKGISNKYKIITSFLLVGVVLSTVFIKQHVIIDIILALLLSVIIFIITKIIKLPIK